MFTHSPVSDYIRYFMAFHNKPGHQHVADISQISYSVQ